MQSSSKPMAHLVTRLIIQRDARRANRCKSLHYVSAIDGGRVDNGGSSQILQKDSKEISNIY